MDAMVAQSILRGITVINWGVPEKEDAEVEAVFDNRTIRVRGRQAWDIVNRRNKARWALDMAKKAGLQDGVDVDHVVVPYALKQAKEIWAIIEPQM